MKHENTKIGILAVSLTLFFAFSGVVSAASLDSEEIAFITLLNDYRKSVGREELKVTKPVLNGAEFLAQNFAEHPDDPDLNIHIDTRGDRPVERGERYGYYFIAENMGWGYDTAEGMFNAWLASEGHRQNMIVDGARTVGVARHHQPGATKNGESVEWFWVLDLSDEGTERLIGHTLGDSEFYFSNFKKITLSVRKWSKLRRYKAARLGEVKVYDQDTGQLLDRDIVDRKGKATLYTFQDPGKVILKVFKKVGNVKPAKKKIFDWNKNRRFNFRLK